MKSHTVRDRITFRSSLLPLKVPAFRVLDALQDQPADVQLDALFLTATLLANGVGLDAHDMVSRSKRIMADAAVVKNPHLEAISEYAAGGLS